MDDSKIESYLKGAGWNIVHCEEKPAVAPLVFPLDDLALSEASKAALSAYESGIYRHQREAIANYLAGSNLAVTTPTASGKTLIFNVAALEELANKNARVLAVYPLKALASEQTLRWKALVERAGIDVKVGRIDGGIAVSERQRILKESRILVVTPDIVHAWLFSSIDSPSVLEFLRNLTLVIADEAHTYSGVFGSNAAFLFRRLVHATKKLGGELRFIASSATMKDPSEHLAKLMGEEFVIIGPELDTSPRAERRTLLATPPKAKDLLTNVSDLLIFAASRTNHQSITFVDSRKQTEYLASIVERRVGEEGENAESPTFDRLREMQIYPYRSGYEEEDRERIQAKLARGTLKGVVSTSALEMGIDLPYLSLGVLYGIPRSGTSLHQRIGRVGRRKPGLIIVVNNGSVVSETVFRDPERITTLPLAQSALYLHNRRIQYIHAMCLARRGGEDESICERAGLAADKFTSPANLPTDFRELCESERVGEIDSDLQSMKSQAGDDPNHTFPLRDLDMQFKVEHRQGPELWQLGSLSYSQLMREAYPGAVYYYQTRPYRVVRVKKHQRVVEVRPEKRYFTSPTMLPTLILPNLAGDNLFVAHEYGELVVLECALQIGEAVVGFKERRGNNEFEQKYPLDPSHGLYHDSAKFARYAFTSGVVLTHPALNRASVKPSSIAEIIGEAFLMSLPFERQDISAGADKHRATRDGVTEGGKFVCVYDQTYGSLRLTSHLMRTEVLRDVFARARDIAINDAGLGLNPATIAALCEMVTCVESDPKKSSERGTAASSEKFVQIVMPGSVGVNVHKDNEEFEVEGVFFSPQLGCLAYRGKHLFEKRKAEKETWRHGKATTSVPVTHVIPLNGESQTGFYDLETGEIFQSLPLDGEF